MMRSKMLWAAAVVGLVALPAMAADYGMPPDIERMAKSNCAAKHPTSFSLQQGCMLNESDAYKALGYQRYPSIEEVKFDIAREAEKARVRKEANYRDPNSRVLNCGPSHRMTERDGCQPGRR